MASSVVATTCPHCNRSIKIPTDYLGRTVRCKGCSKVFSTQAGSEKPAAKPPVTPRQAPAAVPSGPAVDSDTYVKRMARQQRSSSLIFAVIVLLAIGAISAGLFFFKDKIFGLLDQAQQPARTMPDERVESLLVGKEEKLDQRSGDLTQIQAPEKEKRNRRNLARIPAPYPGRALLIGIRNYLYLNPLNPGYRAERSFLRDPLGLHTLQRALITELSFPRDQVLVLSDVDDQRPTVPTKTAIEANITEFASTCRPTDRVVLVLALHAVALGGKTYVLPVDAELPAEGAKPDPERDAKLASRMIPLGWIYEKMKDCKARQKLLILDIAQNDPEAGIFRNTPGALDDTMYQEIKKVPPGVQVWLPCQVKQHSYGFSSAGQNGSAFLDSLCQLSTLSIERNWKLIEKDPGIKAGTLPLVLLATAVKNETSQYLKDRGYDQTPELLGQEVTPAGESPAETTPAPALTLKLAKASNEFVSGQDIAFLIKELGIENDPTRALSPSSFPSLSIKAFEKYRPDYQSSKELEEKLNEWPLRFSTIKAIKALDRSLRTFKMRFSEESDEASFKKKIEKEQETPAYVTAELSDLLDDMKKIDEKRDNETSARWKAHFDYTQARLLAQLAHIQEYSFVLGNKLRKDTPKIKDPKNHNGWIIVPQRRLEQKETRTFDAERQKLLTRIIKEHAGTPWEILARREQATILGLTLQETYLEEGKSIEKPKTR